MRRRGALVCSAGALACVVVACNSLTGLSEAPYDAGAAGDGSTGEAGVEASTDAGAGGETSPDDCPVPPPTVRCDGGLVSCGGGACDIDVRNDLNNCGICGRRCDTTCDQGACSQTLLATSAEPTRVFAVDGASAYIAEGNQLLKVPLDGGGVSGQGIGLGAAANGIADFTLDSPAGYLLTTSDVERASLDGSGTTPLQALQAGASGRLAVDVAGVFLTEGRSGGSVTMLPKDGGSGVTLAQSQPMPTFLLRVGDGVVFANQASGAADGAILQVDLATPGTTHTKIPGLPALGGLVRWGSWGYYSLTKGEIWRFSFADWSPILVASVANAGVIAVDATYVYFAGQLPSGVYGIYRVARCGGDVTPVTLDTHGPVTSLVVDATYAYWVGGSDSNLNRVAK